MTATLSLALGADYDIHPKGTSLRLHVTAVDPPWLSGTVTDTTASPPVERAAWVNTATGLTVIACAPQTKATE